MLNEGEPLAASGLGTPIKAIAVEFHHMLWPDDWFTMTVALADVRTRTFDLEIAGRNDHGQPVFTGRLSPIFVDDATKASCAIPDAFRRKLDLYRQPAG